MIELLPMREGNLAKIVEWNKGKGADFLRQWSGQAYYYPLTEEQLKNRLDYAARKESNVRMFEVILDKALMIGTMELFDIDKGTLRATMGRFLITEEYRGKGHGLPAIREMFKTAKERYHIEELRLHVFEFNIAAQHCYEKAGFVFESLTPNHQEPKWSGYTYLAELYAMDTETGTRTLPDLQPEYIPEKGEPLPDIYTH